MHEGTIIVHVAAECPLVSPQITARQYQLSQDSSQVLDAYIKTAAYAGKGAKMLAVADLQV